MDHFATSHPADRLKSRILHTSPSGMDGVTCWTFAPGNTCTMGAECQGWRDGSLTVPELVGSIQAALCPVALGLITSDPKVLLPSVEQIR